MGVGLEEDWEGVDMGIVGCGLWVWWWSRKI